MKFFLLSFFSVIILIIGSPAYCQSDSYEVNIDILFKDFYKIFNNKILSDYDKTIDYSVEILKYKPKSLEASNVICSLFSIMDVGKDGCLKNKFIKYKEKYFSTIEDYSSNVVEKIMLAYMLSYGFTSKNSDITDQEEMQQNSDIGNEILLKMKENIPDENYRAIVLALIADSDTYYREFLEKYPTHPHADSIERDMIFNYFNNEQYEKYIEEVIKLINKYKLKDIKTPFGYHGAIDCYSLIVSSYVKLKDYKNAQFYLDLIKKEAPNYWEIKSLEEEVEGVRTGVTKNERILKDIIEMNKNNNLRKK